MKTIKILQGYRWFIWTIVFIVVSLGGLATYIYYVSNQDMDEISFSYGFFNKIEPVITQNGVSYVIKNTVDGSYIQLVGGVPRDIIKKINDSLDDVFETSCFPDPRLSDSLEGMREMYNDSAKVRSYKSKEFATEEDVSHMSYKELRQKIMDDFGFESTFNSRVTFINKDFLSISVSEEDFCGGAHPNWGSFGFNFNLKTGENLGFKDLFKDYKKDKKPIESQIVSFLISGSSVDEGCYVDLPSPTSIEDMSYAISDKGIIPLFLGYNHAESACEPQGVVVPFSRLIHYLKSDNSFLEKSIGGDVFNPCIGIPDGQCRE
jgi:hypothetical protein